MPIAGFDPSVTHLGWVVMDENKQGKDALLDFGTFVTSTDDGLIVQRLIMQRERVKAFLINKNISFVAMEAPILEDFSSELLFALNKFLHEVFLNLGIFVVQFQPYTVKKAAYPDMDPKDITKHHMVHKAKTELDRHGRRLSEHVADAYFIAKMGLRFYKWYLLHEMMDKDLSETEQRLFCGSHTFVKGPRKGLTEYTGIIYRPNDQFYDYSKVPRKTENIIKEVENGNSESNVPGRILQKTVEGR